MNKKRYKSSLLLMKGTRGSGIKNGREIKQTKQESE